MLRKREKFSTEDFSFIKSLKPHKVYTDIGVFCIYPTLFNKLGKTKQAIVMTKRVFKTAISRNEYKRLFFNVVVKAKQDKKLPSLVFYPNKNFNKDQLLRVIISVE